MSEFKAGTVVQLKSGGPKMTCYGEPSGSGKVACQWFSGSKLEDGRFTIESLIVVAEEPSPAESN